MWGAPAAATNVCLEELCKARMKRKTSTHVILIAKMFTPVWLKQLNKVVDCHFIIPAKYKFWDPHNFDHLVATLVFPFFNVQAVATKIHT